MTAIRFSAHKRFHLLKTKTRVWEPGIELIEHHRIIIILSGQGKFILDGSIYTYTPNGTVVLKARQKPVFQEDKETEVFVIAFDTHLAEDFQRKKLFSPDFADIYKQAENLCNTVRLTQGKPIANKQDEKTVTFLISQLLFEIGQQPVAHLRVVKDCISMLVTVITRNNFESKKAEDSHCQDPLTESILNYLENELRSGKTVRIAHLLLMLNISEEVANLCIINRTGMSLRNFIFQYKADLFKARMLKVDVADIAPYIQGVAR